MAEIRGALSRNLAPAFEEGKGKKINRCWLTFVGRGAGETIYSNEVNEVEYQIMRSNRQMGQLVKRSDVVGRLLGPNQKNLGLGEFTEVARAFPLSIEEYDIPASKLTHRVFGERKYDGNWTRQMRAAWYAGEGQTHLMARQGNLANHLAGLSIRTGKMPAILGTTDPDEQYDFYRHADNFKVLTDQWTDVSAGKPLDDLDEGVDTVIVKTGKTPQFALCGLNAMAAMLENNQIVTKADNRGFTNFVQVGDNGMECPSNLQFLKDGGWDCRGQVVTNKGRRLWLFSCEDLEASTTGGDDTHAMPLGKVVLGNADSRMDAQYGPPETYDETATDLRNYQEWFGFGPGVTPPGQPQLTSGMVRPDMFILDAYRNNSRTLTTMRSQMSPLYVPVATDEWYTIENAA